MRTKQRKLHLFGGLVATWLPPLLGLTKTKMGFSRGEGSGFSMNGRHLDS